ncbi:serine phosphatase [Candidatus Koribacter versatilis Ellin345]|uniref:Serine phosphatase n=1 Tax=Koribacter versatilis (strain Ellin345) TaxID=204669 RepID=Q1IJG4_KORVE|nr:PP2C family protein-serine/threonine phosphatase [Candidatus Koribacter versatilis]ABF42986.1 serine phosphatase [Candidatus Koribacter versatilis Ellin345]
MTREPIECAVRYRDTWGGSAIKLFAKWNTGSTKRASFWQSLTGPSRLIFFAAVFFTFSCLGFLNVMTTPLRQPAWQIVAMVLGSAIFAIFYAWAGVLRRWWWMIVVALSQVAYFTVVVRFGGQRALLLDPHSETQVQLFWMSLLGKITLIAGYTFFLIFFGREGVRYFQAHAEIKLAQEIHQRLVPTIERQIGRFSLYGNSVPSGEVGGDLVDLVEGGSWTAYVADVSGHGVSAGVLMAMFKTAVRTTVVADSQSNLMLDAVHRALYPLKTPNLFVTAGVLHCDSAGAFSLSLAGHPPLLHYRKSTSDVVEHPAMDLPLGILPEQSFQSTRITMESGDLLVLLTDGFTEVFDDKKNEMGIEPVKATVQSNAARPLPEVFAAVRKIALAFGKQEDDQTLLLIRAN